ncbi:hypothetical protein J437_LFUL000414, partial [Ladona fulva]
MASVFYLAGKHGVLEGRMLLHINRPFTCGGALLLIQYVWQRSLRSFSPGTSGIDIDLRRVDIDQCPLPPSSTQLNIFAASDKCKKRTTECVPIPGLGFRRGSYKCICREGFYFPDTDSDSRYYNGSQIEMEYEKLIM